VAEILRDHWQRFGRNYYSRHDYEAVPKPDAEALMAHVSASLASLPGRQVEGLTVTAADSFSYADPVDQSVSADQGLRIFFEGGGRAVLRLSGTGTEGATLRVYLEQYVSESGAHDRDVSDALREVQAATRALTDMQKHLGRVDPDVKT